MKTIVFVALLAAAGCSKKSSDCEASIAKGMDNFVASIKTSAISPQMQETRLSVVGKLRGTLTQRCNEDKWPAEVVSCFTTVVGMKDMQACQAKLSDEQRTKLMTEIREVMMSSMGSMRMPPGVAGHPPMLGSGGSPGSAGPEASGSGMPGAPAGAAPAPGGSAAATGSAEPSARPAPPAPAGAAAPGSAAGSGGW